MHFVFGEDEAQGGERGGKFKFREGVAAIAIEVAEHRFEFFELDGGQVCHVASYALVFEEGEFVVYGGFYQAKFVREVVVGMCCEVVFFDVGFRAFGFYGGDLGEILREGRELRGEEFDVVELVFGVPF